MKELNVQLTNKYLPLPFSQEDLDKLKTFKPNQVLHIKAWGSRKIRSLQQHKWAMGMIRIVAKNSEDPKWNTFDRAKRQIKMEMKFFEDTVIVIGNQVYFELKSFAFDQMEQPEANRVYNDIKLICAERLGCDPEELEAKAKIETRVNQ